MIAALWVATTLVLFHQESEINHNASAICTRLKVGVVQGNERERAISLLKQTVVTAQEHAILHIHGYQEPATLRALAALQVMPLPEPKCH